MQNSCEFFVYFLSFLQMEAQVLGWDVLQCRYKTQNSGVKVKAKQRQVKSDKKWLFWQLLIGALLSLCITAIAKNLHNFHVDNIRRRETGPAILYLIV